MTPYEMLVDEARRIGWHVHLLIEPVAAPTVRRHSRLSALVLVDSGGDAIATASLLHHDRLDRAAGELIGVIRERRPS